MIPRETIETETAGLSDNHLFDLARNASAPHETRKFAAEKLFDKGAFQASKPEISGLIAEIKQTAEVAEVPVPSAQEADEVIVPVQPGISASFLTSSVR